MILQIFALIVFIVQWVRVDFTTGFWAYAAIIAVCSLIAWAWGLFLLTAVGGWLTLSTFFSKRKVKKLMMSLALGWVLLQGTTYDNTWKKIDTYATWDKCEAIGQTLRQTYSLGSTFFGTAIATVRAPYLCLKERDS